jgi:hypothetical protein
MTRDEPEFFFTRTTMPERGAFDARVASSFSRCG